MISEVIKIPFAFTTLSGASVVLLLQSATLPFDPVVWGEKLGVVALLLLIGWFGAKWATSTITDYKTELKESQEKLLKLKDDVIKSKDDEIVYLKNLLSQKN